MSEHTPGPWMIGGGAMKRCHEKYTIRQSASGRYIARINPLRVGDEEANALLIAEAPELLKALREMLGSASPNAREHPAMYIAWSHGLAALLKATTVEVGPAPKATAR